MRPTFLTIDGDWLNLHVLLYRPIGLMLLALVVWSFYYSIKKSVMVKA
ncbi:hypothetical protein ACFLZL_04540 [Thermodesulfobacteriota bacterium]